MRFAPLNLGALLIIAWICRHRADSGTPTRIAEALQGSVPSSITRVHAAAR